ncbi:hypothetical protein Sgou_32300 [Streptomyces gougerotii]|uniref:Uncharacterized protein n=1 Tax=Streptomyces gougerotii TaxID=53448 RepID=A0ABQ1D7Q6_9ACTN|nr:hypothetical protein Sgou_32300 [Streptomyces gougerotii]
MEPSPYADHVVLPSPGNLPVAAVPYVPEQAAVELEKPAPASWDEVMAAPRAAGGPDTPLEAERAPAGPDDRGRGRHRAVGARAGRARARPVAARGAGRARRRPVALGALLFRTVAGPRALPGGRASPELVQMVCAEPPAFAEGVRPAPAGRGVAAAAGPPPMRPTSRS